MSCGNNFKKGCKASMCFFMDRGTAELFIKGGSNVKSLGPRLATILIPMHKRTVHFINSHFPDSGQKKITLDEYKIKVEGVLQRVQRRDLLVWLRE